MEKRIRMALIGFGGMGQTYAGMIYAGVVPGMVLAGVCCRNAAGQEKLKKEFAGVSIYGDAEEMAACGSAYDAVLIVTPHTSHVPLGMKFAALGKHILLDKPAGVSAGEVQRLREKCTEMGVEFGMIFNNRQLPAFRAAREFLDSGALGELHRAVWVCNSWYRSPAYHRSASWRSSWNGECGGLMLNQNPHYLDMWQWFFGLPDKVYADMQFGRYNAFLVDDAVDIQFHYNTGFHGTFISATGEAPGVNRLEIWGSKGKLMIEDGARVFFDENAMSTVDFGKMNTEKFASIPHEVRELPLEALENPYQRVFDNYARHLLYGDPLFADGTDGLRTAQLTNAIYVSGWEERRVAVPVGAEEYEAGLRKRQDMEKQEKKL
nr:Gfo/Idh/MocA family oxidoreductase [Oscillospiraceae bacterium]